MTSRQSYGYGPDKIDNVPVKLYEGTVTRGDVELSNGNIEEDAITARSAGLKKGSFIKFYNDSSKPGVIQVQLAGIGANDVDDAVGIIVDNPLGNDDVTASGGTPAFAQRRTATAKFFGARIQELNATSAAAIRAGYTVLFSESEEGIIEGGTTLANGASVAAAYTAASTPCPVLMGYYGHLPAD